MPESEEKVPVIFIELSDKRTSGFILDGTEGTPHQVELDSPSVRFIPNVGYRKGVKIDVVNGKKVETRYNERIRYIRNETEISMSEQKRLGIEPNPQAKEDKILIEKGFATIAREGSDVGLFDFILQSYYNGTNLDRSDKATNIYRVIELDKKAESENDEDEFLAQAILYVTSLREKVGDEYVYNEPKIDAVCTLFNVIAESYPTKIQALRAFAKQFPTQFLAKVSKLGATAATEIAHGLQLNVINFEGNSAVYVNKQKVIKVLGSGNMTMDKKISALADYFNTKDGYEAYNEFKAELDAAKEKSIK